MNYLLFAVYLILLCWLLLRIPFIKRSGISSKLVVGLFLIKVLAGIAVGWLSVHVYGPGNDYWDMNAEAWKEYQLLISNPREYFTNIFSTSYPGGYAGIFNSFNSYWNDLKGNIVIKLVSVFNIFSRGDYYINSLFFNFVVFSAHVILYKLFVNIFPHRKTLVIIGAFLLPSTLYFSSGIHKDGIVFLMLAVLIYSVHQSLQQKRFTKRRVLMICSSMVLLFLLRNFIFIALVPAMAAWVISAKTKWPAYLVFTAVYSITGLLLFNIGSVSSEIKPLEIITRKQAEYLNLPHSDTEIKLTVLQPTFKSFASNAPESFNHLLFRPYLWELPVKSLLPLNIELLVYQVLFFLFLFFRTGGGARPILPFLYFALFFVLTVFLLTGYIVPNLGSIVRYRSIYLPLLVIPLLCSVNWERLKNYKK